MRARPLPTAATTESAASLEEEERSKRSIAALVSDFLMLERCACADACGLNVDGAPLVGLADGAAVAASKLCNTSLFAVSARVYSSTISRNAMFQDRQALHALKCVRGALVHVDNKVCEEPCEMVIEDDCRRRSMVRSRASHRHRARRWRYACVEGTLVDDSLPAQESSTSGSTPPTWLIVSVLSLSLSLPLSMYLCFSTSVVRSLSSRCYQSARSSPSRLACWRG